MDWSIAERIRTVLGSEMDNIPLSTNETKAQRKWKDQREKEKEKVWEEESTLIKNVIQLAKKVFEQNQNEIKKINSRLFEFSIEINNLFISMKKQVSPNQELFFTLKIENLQGDRFYFSGTYNNDTFSDLSSNIQEYSTDSIRRIHNDPGKDIIYKMLSYTSQSEDCQNLLNRREEAISSLQTYLKNL